MTWLELCRAARPKRTSAVRGQMVGCAVCGETERTPRRVGENLLCPECAGQTVSKSDTAAPAGIRGSRSGPLVLREIIIDEKEDR